MEQPQQAPAPQPQVIYVQQPAKRSCFGGMMKWIGIGVVACIGLVVVAVVLLGLGSKAATDKAIDNNGGRGSEDEPIAANTFMKFENGEVRATRLIRPATRDVSQMNQFNDEPAAGAEWVLVWFEVKCEQDECRQSQLNLKLVDAEGKEWGEPILITLDTPLDDAIEGATMQGWQAFEFPQTGTIDLIKVGWSSVSLYQEPPAVE